MKLFIETSDVYKTNCFQKVQCFYCNIYTNFPEILPLAHVLN